MVLLLSETDVAQVMSMADGVRVVERALYEHCLGNGTVMPRISAEVPGGGGMFRVMSAILPGAGFFGLKTLTGYPGRRLAGETYFAVLLFDAGTGGLRAVIAATQLTGIRTGAATGVAAKVLSRPASRVLGVLGAGVQARYQVAALAEVRSLEEIRIFDVDAGKAEIFAEEIATDHKVAARRVASAHDAVVGCDLVVTVTAAKTPVLDGHWLEHGTHVSGVGANSPAKRELDATTFRRSRIVVDFREQVLQEAGDLQDALRAGVIREDDIHAELGEILAAQRPGRQSDAEITLFKSVGMAIEDIATASFVYDRALAAGVGTALDLNGLPRAISERVAQAVHASPLQASLDN